MVALLLCGVSLEDEAADAFNVSDNAASTCDVEEATYTSSCVIVVFAAKFTLSAALIMDEVREQLLLVGVSETLSGTTS